MSASKEGWEIAPAIAADERESHLGEDGPEVGRRRRADAEQRERGGEQPLLGEPATEPPHAVEAEQGARARRGEGEPVPAERGVTAAEPEGDEEREEARGESHRRARGEPKDDLSVLERPPVELGDLLVGERGLLVTRVDGADAQPHRAHRRGDEHERREDQDRLGVEGLEQADPRHRDREPRERAEQGELRVEAREALGDVGARPRPSAIPPRRRPLGR